MEFRNIDEELDWYLARAACQMREEEDRENPARQSASVALQESYDAARKSAKEVL